MMEVAFAKNDNNAVIEQGMRAWRKQSNNKAINCVAEQVPAPRNPSQTKPVAQPAAAPVNSQFNRSQAWIHSWTPYAEYTVHVQGPSSTVRAAAEVTSPIPPETSKELIQDQATETIQRKSSEIDYHGDKSSDGVEGQVQDDPPSQREVAAEKSDTKDVKEEEGERARKALLALNLPQALLKKFQVNPKDVEAILNNKESTARANERLRALQREFEMRKDQLSYVYPALRNQN